MCSTLAVQRCTFVELPGKNARGNLIILVLAENITSTCILLIVFTCTITTVSSTATISSTFSSITYATAATITYNDVLFFSQLFRLSLLLLDLSFLLLHLMITYLTLCITLANSTTLASIYIVFLHLRTLSLYAQVRSCSLMIRSRHYVS